jgi:hypothetical protein
MRRDDVKAKKMNSFPFLSMITLSLNPPSLVTFCSRSLALTGARGHRKSEGKKKENLFCGERAPTAVCQVLMLVPLIGFLRSANSPLR